MDVISLITDFGYSDNFVGVLKAVILKINPRAKIIDVCHEVKPQDVIRAALLLNDSFGYFPRGTVHLAVVDPAVGSERKMILVKTKNYFFAGPDNGILSLALKKEPIVKIIDVTDKRYFLTPVSDTFHGRDIFAPVCAYISKGYKIDRFGKEIKLFQRLSLPPVEKKSKVLVGEIMLIDRFGNLRSNITGDIFNNFTKSRKFNIQIKGKTINKLSHSYCQAPYLKPLAIIGSFDYLEIAVNKGSAHNFLGAGYGTKIKINIL